MVIVFPVILQDQVSKRWSNIIAKFHGHWYCVIGNIVVLIFHVILQGQAIKGSCHMTLLAGSHQGKLSSCQV